MHMQEHAIGEQPVDGDTPRCAKRCAKVGETRMIVVGWFEIRICVRAAFGDSTRGEWNAVCT